jgi:hypothetical protein
VEIVDFMFVRDGYPVSRAKTALFFGGMGASAMIVIFFMALQPRRRMSNSLLGLSDPIVRWREDIFCKGRREVVVSQIPNPDPGRPPVHRDKTAMNGRCKDL